MMCAEHWQMLSPAMQGGLARKWAEGDLPAFYEVTRLALWHVQKRLADQAAPRRRNPLAD
jgi:hypothetical protein